MVGDDKRQTPTDFLISAMQDIEGSEDVVLVSRKVGPDGVEDIGWMSNGVMIWKMIGMLEFAKMDIFQQTMEEDE
jgi:hypothetical protein